MLNANKILFSEYCFEIFFPSNAMQIVNKYLMGRRYFSFDIQRCISLGYIYFVLHFNERGNYLFHEVTAVGCFFYSKKIKSISILCIFLHYFKNIVSTTRDPIAICSSAITLRPGMDLFFLDQDSD